VSVRAAGSITAVVGPNGSGKSTLVRALLRRVAVRSGQILVGGDDVTSLSQRELARRVAVVVQREEPAFPIRASDYIALGRTPYASSWGDAGDPRARAAIDEAVATADVSALLDRHTDELSGGYGNAPTGTCHRAGIGRHRTR
jgi:iron complex transport system ATP-binding protein